jgi:hypothetical protein
MRRNPAGWIDDIDTDRIAKDHRVYNDGFFYALLMGEM